ncbi:MAG: hypothetical protein KDJ50_07855 [Alphaproteobacteria bacterium]|mgnify:CR=1 FL=1|nr:hypothetical protein [Alphaproteobacteria bacterium]
MTFSRTFLFFLFLSAAVFSLPNVSFADEHARVLKLCETHRRLANEYDCSCYVDVFLKNQATQTRKSDKIVMGAVNAEACKKGGVHEQRLAACLNRSQHIDGTMKEYCQCLYQEDKNNLVDFKNTPNRQIGLNKQMAAGAKNEETCNRKFGDFISGKLVGAQKLKKRLSDFAFDNVFNFDYLVCADFGVAAGQTQEKTHVRSFVNSLCPQVEAIRDSNPARDIDSIIQNAGAIQSRVDAEYPSLVSSASGSNKTYLQKCNIQKKTCAEQCARHQVNVGGVCPCGIQMLSCITQSSLDME